MTWLASALLPLAIDGLPKSTSPIGRRVLRPERLPVVGVYQRDSEPRSSKAMPRRGLKHAIEAIAKILRFEKSQDEREDASQRADPDTRANRQQRRQAERARAKPKDRRQAGQGAPRSPSPILGQSTGNRISSARHQSILKPPWGPVGNHRYFFAAAATLCLKTGLRTGWLSE